jgi:Rne/Rng family ribonuclease
MAKELIINATLPEVRIALMDEGRIQELLIERESEKGIVGNIYKGRVTRVLPGMQAAFVDVGLDKAAFLYVDDIYVHPQVMGEETELSLEEESAEADEGTPRLEADSAGERASEGGSDGALESSGVGMRGGDAEDVPSAFSTTSAAADTGEEPPEFDSEEESIEDLRAEFAEGAESDDAEDEGEDEGEDDEGADVEGTDADEDESEDDALYAEAAESPEDGVSSGVSVTESTSRSTEEGSLSALQDQGQGRRGRRGRSRNRRRRGRGGEGRGSEGRHQFAGGESHEDPSHIPSSVNESLNDSGVVESDRAAMGGESGGVQSQGSASGQGRRARPEFREQRGRDRRIKSKALRPRAQANIADLLKEGQEVIVQVAKDPIATKGARLTCHVSLPGRHLVCMPSIDHVGVSRRIEREDERRRLRDFVERNRPRKMGFIVRTASGGKDPESWIKQDIDYLSKLWTGIRTKADEVSAPSLVYEDLTSILRAIRDWVNEDIDRIVVDTRYHYNELIGFAERFMPTLIEKIELYQGDIPIFDAYGLSSELHRAMERKVWLKSGGYIVIDQAEALVAVDVNTGRFVGKKNLEDTILKTNLEAAEEIAYQLRLRNCGGIIIVDFIDMEREDNKMRVYRALDEALKRDRARPTIQKISELGLVEMTRKRTRDTLVRSLCEPCSHCEGRGFMKSHSTVAYEILREVERLSVDRDAKKILVSAHEAVINILAIELRDALDQLERRYNKSVYLQAVMDFHGEQFEVVSDRPSSKKPNQDIARQLRMERERTERREKGRSRGDRERGDRQDRERGDRQDRERGDRQDRERHRHGRDRMDAGERNQDRQHDRNADRQAERNIDKSDSQPRVPAVRPSGAFISAKPAVNGSQTQVNPVQAPAAAEARKPSREENEDRQPDFGAAAPMPDVQRDFSEMDDEDQLAYLRAQAAQDAAIAGLSNPGSGQPRYNRGQQSGRGQGQGQQNRGGRHGQPRHQDGQNHQNRNRNQQQRGNRFRPQQANGNMPGNMAGNMAVQTMEPRPERREPSPEVSVPDYEVLNRGDGSES